MLMFFFINLQVVLTVRDPKGWYRSMTDVIVMAWSSVIAKYAYLFKCAGCFDSAVPEGLVQVCDRVLL